MEQLVDITRLIWLFIHFGLIIPQLMRKLFIIFYWDAAHRYLSFMPDMASRNDMQVEAVFKPALEKSF